MGVGWVSIVTFFYYFEESVANLARAFMLVS